MGKKEFYLYRERTLSDKLNDTFGFIRDNWQVMLKFCIYLVLPLCMVTAVFTNGSLDAELFKSAGTESIWQSSAVERLSQLFSSITSAIVVAMVYAFVQLYMKRENGLENLQMSELKDPLLNNIGKSIILGIVLAVGLVIVMVLYFLLVFFLFSSSWGLIALSFILMFALLLPVMLAQPVYLMEDNIGAIESIKKGFRLGWHTWGSFALLLFVLAIICSLLGLMVFIPRIGVLVYDSLVAESQGVDVASPSLLVSFVHYLLTVLLLFGSDVVSIVFWLGIIFHYGHAAEKIDGMATDQAIEDFEEL